MEQNFNHMSFSPFYSRVGAPLDLDFLNSVTGGKPAVLEELLELFFVNASECLAVLERSLKNDHDEARWSRAAAELKVLADNVGAVALAKACNEAFSEANSAFESKRKIFSEVRLEVQKLKTYFQNNPLQY
jgi:hypothetical protein